MNEQNIEIFVYCSFTGLHLPALIIIIIIEFGKQWGDALMTIWCWRYTKQFQSLFSLVISSEWFPRILDDNVKFWAHNDFILHIKLYVSAWCLTTIGIGCLMMVSISGWAAHFHLKCITTTIRYNIKYKLHLAYIRGLAFGTHYSLIYAIHQIVRAFYHPTFISYLILVNEFWIMWSF